MYAESRSRPTPAWMAASQEVLSERDCGRIISHCGTSAARARHLGNLLLVSSVEELTQQLRTFADERDWGQFHTPKNLVTAAAGEMGELVAEFQWLTAERSAAVMDDPEAGARVWAEPGDVVIYLTRLADVLGVDLVQAALDKFEASAMRYPVESSRGSAAKAPHDHPPAP
jgi:NTP pyrophosphatase (non-canonical NTP hydrolase)